MTKNPVISLFFEPLVNLVEGVAGVRHDVVRDPVDVLVDLLDRLVRRVQGDLAQLVEVLNRLVRGRHGNLAGIIH